MQGSRVWSCKWCSFRTIWLLISLGEVAAHARLGPDSGEETAQHMR